MNLVPGVVVAAVVALAAACGSTSGASGVDLASQAAPAASAALPLEGLFFDDQAVNQLDIEVQAVVRVCMAERGFEYRSTSLITVGEQDVERHGGMTIAEQMRNDLGVAETAGTAVEDSLSAADRSDVEVEAYELALYGTKPTEQQVADPTFWASYTPDGCQGIATGEVMSQRFGPDLESLLARQVDVRIEAEERAESDPRILDLADEFSTCMSAQGMQASSPAAALEVVQANADQLAEDLADARIAVLDSGVPANLDADTLRSLDELDQLELQVQSSVELCMDSVEWTAVNLSVVQDIVEQIELNQ